MTIRISSGRIVAIGPKSDVPIPRGATVISCSGKFVIPGLWDMHVHIERESAWMFPLLVANGITGVRDMGGPLDVLKRLRSGVRNGDVLGPTIFLAGPYLDGPRSQLSFTSLVNTPEQGRAAVRKLRVEGADFVKVQGWLPRQAYFAIADEAKSQGLPFAGHVPAEVSASEASSAGQKSIEHLSGVLMASSIDEASLRVSGTNRAGTAQFLIYEELLSTFDPVKAKTLFEEFAANRTWQTPTLVIWHVMASLDDAGLYSDQRLQYAPQWVVRAWNPKIDRHFRDFGPRERQLAVHLFQRYASLVAQMHRAGVPILAGSDTPYPFCIPGFSLHDELRLLVEAGLSPWEAIKTATLNPAKYLGVERSFGTVQEGKVGDLVILDGNPLEDIRYTQRIFAVVLKGRWLPRSSLESMKQAASAGRAEQAQSRSAAIAGDRAALRAGR